MEQQILHLDIPGRFHKIGGSVKLKPNAMKCIIAGVSVVIVILAFASVVVNFQDQLSQKDEQIQMLQDQIEELRELLGPVKMGEWNVIESYGGSSAFTTDYFYVTGTELRLNWTRYSGTEVSSIFSFHIYKEGQSEYIGEFKDLDDQGTTFLRNIEKGNYYLDIYGSEVDQWSITVETWIPPE